MLAKWGDWIILPSKINIEKTFPNLGQTVSLQKNRCAMFILKYAAVAWKKKIFGTDFILQIKHVEIWLVPKN